MSPQLHSDGEADAGPLNVNEVESEREPLIRIRRSESTFQPTIEIPLLFISFGATLSGAVANNYLLFRTCVNALNYNVSKCELLQSLESESDEIRRLESEVQARVAMMLMALAVFSGVVPAILSFFLGAWSDKHGRKPLILFPMFGMVASSSLLIAFCLIPGLGPWWFVLSFLPYSLAGGDSTLAMGSYCYVTDITSDSNRTFRLAVFQGTMFLGSMLGSVASSYVFAAIGYTYLFILSTVLYAAAWLYALFWVTESVVDAERGSIRSLFNLRLVQQMCSTCFKSRPNNTGTTLFLLIMANSITMFAISGISNIDYLFTRQTFHWMLKEYSIFSACNTVVLVFGMLVGIAFLQNVCRVGDAILTIMAYVSSIMDATVRSLARRPWHMYLAGGLSMLGGLSPPLIRSMITKVVAEDEVGQIFALVSSCEAIVPILSPMLYNTLYVSTLTTFPGAIYAMSAGLFGVCLLLVVWTQCLMFRNPVHKLYSNLSFVRAGSSLQFSERERTVLNRTEPDGTSVPCPASQNAQVIFGSI